MKDNHSVVLCTCPNKSAANKLTTKLVEQKLAACVTSLPGVKSTYIWQGQVETTTEFLLLIKSSRRNYTAIESLIRALHPYECPEIIAIPIENGLPDYLKWIDETTST